MYCIAPKHLCLGDDIVWILCCSIIQFSALFNSGVTAWYLHYSSPCALPSLPATQSSGSGRIVTPIIQCLLVISLGGVTNDPCYRGVHDTFVGYWLAPLRFPSANMHHVIIYLFTVLLFECIHFYLKRWVSVLFQKTLISYVTSYVLDLMIYSQGVEFVISSLWYFASTQIVQCCFLHNYLNVLSVWRDLTPESHIIVPTPVSVIEYLQ